MTGDQSGDPNVSPPEPSPTGTKGKAEAIRAAVAELLSTTYPGSDKPVTLVRIAISRVPD